MQAELPKETMTVAEAAQVLGISRGVAYSEAKAYEQSGGRTGLPVIRMGNRLIVPVARLRALLEGKDVS